MSSPSASTVLARVGAENDAHLAQRYTPRVGKLLAAIGLSVTIPAHSNDVSVVRYTEHHQHDPTGEESPMMTHR